MRGFAFPSSLLPHLCVDAAHTPEAVLAYDWLRRIRLGFFGLWINLAAQCLAIDLLLRDASLFTHDAVNGVGASGDRGST